jgi:DNA polymerase-3 subunit delta'
MSWQHIRGHDRWIQAFDDIVRRHRLAHAYLFVGPTGVGKRLFAGTLAKALLCDQPGSPLAPCEACVSCLLVQAGTHPDLFLVERAEDANEVKIDQMRELSVNFALKPARGHGKVAIIDDADLLNDESANCFLKTLEEPPPRSTILLIGTSLERQLPTIRSRCQVVRFAPLRDDVLRDLLKHRISSDSALIDGLVRLADGSPGQALLLADPNLWGFRDKLLRGLAQPKIKAVELAKAFTEFVEEAGKETVLHRNRAAQVLRLLLAAFKDILHLTLESDLPTQQGEDVQLLQALARKASPEKVLALEERCLQAEMQIGRYIQVSLVLEGLMEGLTQILES